MKQFSLAGGILIMALSLRAQTSTTSVSNLPPVIVRGLAPMVRPAYRAHSAPAAVTNGLAAARNRVTSTNTHVPQAVRSTAGGARA
ncbi:MAG: hypothetical protein NTZ16_12125, partial [Verrucomicrobia bacterium]|nr:hypothetical protein [Verrucomicrobiota bacterium]